MKLSMEDLVDFLQVSLSKNFGYDDDAVVEQLQISMTDLRRVKLELPPPGTANSMVYANKPKPTVKNMVTFSECFLVKGVM